MLMRDAAQKLKKTQEREAAERKKAIDERCGNPKPTEGLSRGQWQFF
jgi:hypothetical protein